MKTIVSGILIGFLAVSVLGPGQIFAQTASVTSTVQAKLDLISNLSKQIKILQDQLSQLREQKQESLAQLSAALKQGSEGDQVKVLQALLAANPDIYPEGLITGYFGSATARAVKRFQKENKLEQVGFVGPKTLDKLNKVLTQNPISWEENGKRLCVILQPGHLIAKGWLKKNEKPLVPVCQKLPPGIMSKLGLASSTPTSTPPAADTAPPVIASTTITGITSSTAVIGWTTNEPASSKIYYGLNSPLNLAAASTSQNSAFGQVHSLALANLNTSSTYYLVVESKDAANNAATSTQFSLMTLP